MALGQFFLKIISVLMEFRSAHCFTVNFISMLFVPERQAGDALNNSKAMERKLLI
jgi:hypothetical protein